jgi:hypothetical protein
MQALVFWIAVGFSCALGACVLVGLLCKTGEKLRTFWRCGWALVVVAAVAIIHGGTKNITNRFTADTGLAVVKAELTIPTNDVDYAYLEVSWIGPDEPQAVHARDAASEAWGFLGEGWMFDDRVYANGTNTACYFVIAPASNVVPRAHYHLGSDLPPVEIEGEGVEILGFADSSTNVVLTYGVNAAALGGTTGTVRIEVQDRAGAAGVYQQSVSGGVTNTVTIPGFWINRDTRWRVRLEVGE